MPALRFCLKEWSVAVTALLQGQTLLLFRKGGIREQHQAFHLIQGRALLFPTYEHQKPSLLQSPQDLDEEQGPYQPGQSVTISGWVDFTHTFVLKNLSLIQELRPYHIWSDQFLEERLRWRPERPLQALICKAYCLPSPIDLVYQRTYGGCQSWIELTTAVDISHSRVVLPEEIFQKQAQHIAYLFSNP